MRNTLRFTVIASCLGLGWAGWAAGCSSSDSGSPTNVGGTDSGTDGGGMTDAVTPTGDSSAPPTEAGADGSSATYTLIEDMETTTNGPIELTGITPPLLPAYWFNFVSATAGDTTNPPYMSFAFSAISPTHTTLNGVVSAHAATQDCTISGLYDVCGIGMEFTQITDPDAGIDASSPPADAGDAGDAGPPRVTVPFDISQYKGITFWGKANDLDSGMLDIKVSFPDVDTDPRGGICNSGVAFASGPTDTSQCYNNWSEHVMFTGDWQQFTVMFSDLGIEGFGFQGPNPFVSTPGMGDGGVGAKTVYGISWQAQDNAGPDAGVLDTNFSVDDVYFIQ